LVRRGSAIRFWTLVGRVSTKPSPSEASRAGSRFARRRDQALEDVAFRLVEEWIWYDEEDALTERARYAHYGYPVRGANLKSEKLALLRSRSQPYSTLAPEAEAVREALVSQWLKAA